MQTLRHDAIMGTLNDIRGYLLIIVYLLSAGLLVLVFHWHLLPFF